MEWSEGEGVDWATRGSIDVVERGTGSQRGEGTQAAGQGRRRVRASDLEKNRMFAYTTILLVTLRNQTDTVLSACIYKQEVYPRSFPISSSLCAVAQTEVTRSKMNSSGFLLAGSSFVDDATAT